MTSSFLVFSLSKKRTLSALPNRGYSKFLNVQTSKAENQTGKRFQELTDALFRNLRPAFILQRLFYSKSNFNLSIFIGSYRKQSELRYKNWALFFTSI